MTTENLRFTPPENPEDLTPMMQQYMNVKRDYPDCILMYRIGDFFEMFFEDARIVSEALELTLTGKACGTSERAAMCGVPHQTAETYIARMIAAGLKVAVCDQTEDPAQAKGLVKRDVLRVVTPGTVTDASMLVSDTNNYLCAAFGDDSGAGLAFCDISTGEVKVTELSLKDFSADLLEECALFSPREVLLSKAAATQRVLDTLKYRGSFVSPCYEERFDPDMARIDAQFDEHPTLDELPHAVHALSALLSYLAETQKTALDNLRTLETYSRNQYMILDSVARRNLELFETLRGHEKRGSLLWVLDHTCTAMGTRALRRWLEQPLTNPAEIGRRQNAVELLCADEAARRAIRDAFAPVQDLERLQSRVALGTANARDLSAIGVSLQALPALKSITEKFSCELMQELSADLDPLEDISELVTAAFVDNPPVTVHDAGMIRGGYSAEVDELRVLVEDSRSVVREIENRERERSGIRTLRIGYNRVFGYYIEVSRAQSDAVPADYIRKQTLVNGERFITPELKELETKVLTARERINGLEYELFCDIRNKVAAATERIQKTASALAILDVLTDFAHVACRNNYCRPEVDASDALTISAGRHPVIEQIIGHRSFIANDVRLNCSDHRVAIITGPNMAGKSTYMRQTALIVLMAQIGSFVPAASARIGICDRIFTRVGASDDLASGQSTFMVEMSEVAQIVRMATSRSLLILDEIGRGTSTYDGMSIARAVVEYAADPRRLGARTMFATHYHELTSLADDLQGVDNYATAVKKRGDDITFLRRIIPGGADDSYGIEVAKLAGIPDPIIRRAKEILKALEDSGNVKAVGKRRTKPAPQTTLADFGAHDLVCRIRGLDLDSLTPMQALNLLYELKSTAETLP